MTEVKEEKAAKAAKEAARKVMVTDRLKEVAKV